MNREVRVSRSDRGDCAGLLGAFPARGLALSVPHGVELSGEKRQTNEDNLRALPVRQPIVVRAPRVHDVQA